MDRFSYRSDPLTNTLDPFYEDWISNSPCFRGVDSRDGTLGLAGPACAGDVVAAAALLAADREYAEDAPRDVESPLFGTTQGMRLAGRAIFIEQEHSHLGCFNLVVC